MLSLPRFAVTAFAGGFFVFATPAFSETQIAPEDFPWALEDGRAEDVRIEIEDVGTISMDWLDVKRYDDDTVTVALPPRAMFVGAFGNGLSFNSEIASDNWVMDFSRSKDRDDVSFDLTAETFDLIFETLPDVTQETAAIEGSVTGTDVLLTARAAQFAALFEAAKAGSDPNFELLNALELAFTMQTQSLVSRTAIPDPANPVRQQISLNESGPNNTWFSMGNGKFAIRGDVESGRIVESDPVPVAMDHGAMSFEFVMPFDASPDPQEFLFAFRLADIALDEETWALVDPEGVFPRDIGGFAFDASMEATIPTPLFDRAAMRRAAAKGAEPIQPVSMTLNEFDIDALGLLAKGDGTVALDGKLPTALSALFSIKGLSEFLDDALELGLLKPPQAMMAEGMANQLGKKEADGSIVFDIGLDGGMITVNDAPVMPLPQ